MRQQRSSFANFRDFPSSFYANGDQSGQGLTEYAMLLVLVAMAVVAALSLLGPTVGNLFSEVNASLQGQPTQATDTIVITRADYNPSSEMLHLDVTSNSGADPGTVVTASPGGQMGINGNHYHLNYAVEGCPCTITVSSSLGGTASVDIGN